MLTTAPLISPRSDFGKDPRVAPLLAAVVGDDPDAGDLEFGSGDTLTLFFDRPTNISTDLIGGVQPREYVDSVLSVSEPLGIELAFNPNGVVIALIFIGLPFVVRTVQPVLEDTEKELEEAATCLGATRWQTFSRVIFPSIAPALLTGFAMAFARAIGEYGSVIFIAGNMPMVSEITPLIIIGKLEQYDYAGATAVALVMLVASFVLLLVINALQTWQRRRSGAAV